MYVYGALAYHQDDDTRADLDAVLLGVPTPTELREKAENERKLWEVARAGEIA